MNEPRVNPVNLLQFLDDPDEFIRQRVKTAEENLTNIPGNQFTEHGDKAETIFHKIHENLTQEVRHLMLDYEIEHSGMWGELVDAAYTQGLKDGYSLSKIAVPRGRVTLAPTTSIKKAAHRERREKYTLNSL